MRRPLPVLTAALALAGCGASANALLTDRQAESLLDQVDEAEQAVVEERCVDAREAAQLGETRARALRRIDRDLRRNLVEWFRHLEQRIGDECQREPEETPTPVATPEETETPEETATPEETETPTPTAEPTETAEPEPTPGTGGQQGPGDEGAGADFGEDFG